MGHDDRQGIFVLRANVDEVNVETVDLGDASFALTHSMNATHGRPLGALAALSLLRDPLADIGRATSQFDALGFGLCEKLHRVTVNQLYLCEFDGDDTASLERAANNLQVFRRNPTTHVKNQTVFSRKSVDSAGHWLA
jgi:hypothetical protein